MFQWLRNLFKTSPEPPTSTELIARMVELEAEWQSFLEMQARIARRAAKRVKDESKHAPEPNGVPNELLTTREAQLQAARDRARQAGLYRKSGQ